MKASTNGRPNGPNVEGEGSSLAPSPTTRPQQQWFAGRWCLGALLGGGHHSKVYLGVDSTGRTAAVKLVEVAYLDRDSRERFVQEAILLATLSHPAIAGFVDFAFDQKLQAYGLVVEYIAGDSLRLRLREGVWPSLESILMIGADVASALAAVHIAGVMHGDLKPSNIMLPRRQSLACARLIDFGASRITRRSPNPDSDDAPYNEVLGTPAYMAPEQIMGEPPCQASDMYALGVLLFELLTGTPPYQGNDMRLLDQHIEAEIPDLASQWSFKGSPPTMLLKLVSDLLAKHPAQRPDAVSAERSLRQTIRAIRNLDADRRKAPQDAEPKENLTTSIITRRITTLH